MVGRRETGYGSMTQSDLSACPGRWSKTSRASVVAGKQSLHLLDVAARPATQTEAIV